ncbi:glutathione peroxidase [Robertkochia flava]|uniref:glutathione peroxidase n=1 Tax=Robertkochia flava TaxID=3447986 RepID=UPI0039786708
MAANNEIEPVAQQKNVYGFEVEDINGELFKFSDLKGKKIMIVNTASKCGLTPQYEQLQELYETYGGDDFIIVGFPANNFGNQEPGTNTEIAEFCSLNFGVSFPMMSKISVKGEDMHPVYRFLTQKSENGVMDSEVTWNFQKYLIDEDGTLVAVVDPQTLPTDPSITEWILK